MYMEYYFVVTYSINSMFKRGNGIMGIKIPKILWSHSTKSGIVYFQELKFHLEMVYFLCKKLNTKLTNFGMSNFFLNIQLVIQSDN